MVAPIPGPKIPELTLDEAKSKVQEKTYPKITVDFIQQQIAQVKYLADDTLTICIITIWNGFRVLGHSAPASPDNFDREVGKRFAYENAFRQLWPLFGFRLCDALTGGVMGIGGPFGHHAHPSYLPDDETPLDTSVAGP